MTIRMINNLLLVKDQNNQRLRITLNVNCLINKTEPATIYHWTLCLRNVSFDKIVQHYHCVIGTCMHGLWSRTWAPRLISSRLSSFLSCQSSGRRSWHFPSLKRHVSRLEFTESGCIHKSLTPTNYLQPVWYMIVMYQQWFGWWGGGLLLLSHNSIFKAPRRK